jgi:hypothetical protein
MYSSSAYSKSIPTVTGAREYLYRRPPLREPSPEEFLLQLDVAPLHASASNDRVDVGLLAEHGEACLLDVVKKVGRLHPEVGCWEAVRLDQELSNVDRVADPVLVKVGGAKG